MIHRQLNKYYLWALIGIVLSIFSFIFILQWVSQSQKNPHSVPPTVMSQTFEVQTSKSQETTLVTEASVSVTEPIVPVVMSKYLDLYEENPDLVGWIKVNNMIIDYPVVQTSDNETYLHLDFYGNESKYGTIFLDYESDINNLNAPCNLILYGHKMKDKSMFGELEKYKEESFFTENPTISFDTLYQDYTWEIFSVYITDVSFNYINTTFPSDADWADFLATCAGKSMYETNVVPTSDDIILTLSTCTYEFENARFVVQARLVKETTP